MNPPDSAAAGIQMIFRNRRGIVKHKYAGVVHLHRQGAVCGLPNRTAESSVGNGKALHPV